MLLRLCGAGAASAGLLFVAWGYLDGKVETPLLVSAVQVLSSIVPLLFFVGLLGICHPDTVTWGWLGRIGLAFGLVGAAWGVALSFVDGPSLWGYLAVRDWYARIFFWWLPALLLGVMLAGIGSVGKQESRGYGALLISMGLSGWVYYFTDPPQTLPGAHAIHVVFGLLFSLGWVMLGHAFWKRGSRRGTR